MQLLTVNQVAAMLQVSRRQVYRLIDCGLPALRVGTKSLRFDPEAIALWLREQRTAVGA